MRRGGALSTIGFMVGVAALARAGACWWVHRTARRHSRGAADRSARLADDRGLVFVLRAYDEANVVGRAVALWGDVLARHPRTELVVACSASEEPKDGTTTAQVARDAVRERVPDDVRDRIRVLEIPGAPGAPRQTNEAVKATVAGRDARKLWIKTLDIDTVVDDDVLSELMWAIDRDHRVIEVPAAFTLNYRTLPVLQKWHAVYQDRWSTNYEQFRGLLKNRWPAVYSGVSGAGGCFRADTLLELGLFPEHVVLDDLALSWRINSQGIPVHTTVARLHSDVPESLSEGLAQEYRWSLGALDATTYAHRLRRSVGGSGAFAAELATVWANVVWGAYSPALFLGVVMAWRLRNPWYAVPAVISTIGHARAMVAINRKFGQPWWSTIAMALLLPVQIARTSAPFLGACVLRLVGRRGDDEQRVRKARHS